MSIVKTKLKNARDYLGKKKYDSAKDAALQVLDYEPDNYNANVFLGLASLELGDLDESEKAYRRATELNPDQLLAWQGLSQFYQRKSDWDNYADVLFDLMKIYAQSQDALKCAETLQKYIDIRRQHGNTGQVIEALSFLLPSSPFYTLLSTLPTPDPTSPTSTTTFAIQSSIYNGLAVLEELINIVERQETELFEKELEKRRTRLGAPGLDQIKKEVGTEIWSSSQLPSLYNEILNHPNTSDNLRRETESKLLRYKVKLLHALPTTADAATMKNKIREEITDLISGAVLLKLPDELAWTLFIEGKDVETISEYDYGLWRQFINLFPHSHLSSVFRGYLIYMQLPLSDDDDSDDVNTSEKGAPEAADIGYDMIMVFVLSFMKIALKLETAGGL
ncbi:Superkiller protein 3 [Stygiomarasmius scandens]|uniref:Superkiller protein 3 n=1 Tax=Marasmiellus scandens TaxID=2682957 RepID=A0ABR1JTF4_9AGAR